MGPKSLGNLVQYVGFEVKRLTLILQSDPDNAQAKALLSKLNTQVQAAANVITVASSTGSAPANAISFMKAENSTTGVSFLESINQATTKVTQVAQNAVSGQVLLPTLRSYGYKLEAGLAAKLEPIASQADDNIMTQYDKYIEPLWNDNKLFPNASPPTSSYGGLVYGGSTISTDDGILKYTKYQFDNWFFGFIASNLSQISVWIKAVETGALTQQQIIDVNKFININFISDFASNFSSFTDAQKTAVIAALRNAMQSYFSS